MRARRDPSTAAAESTATGSRAPSPPTSGTSSTLASVFIGREEIVGAVVRALAEPNGMGIVLHGPRRIGKTAILKHLKFAIPELTGHTPVYFDPQERAAQPLDTVIADLACAVAEALDLPEPQPSAGASAWMLDAWMPSALRGLEPGVSLVLLVDELDIHAHPGAESAARALHPFLRRLVEAHAPRLRLVIALGRNARDGENDHFARLPSRRVSLFSREEAGTLVRAAEPPAWSDEAVEAAWELTAGHPLLFSVLASNARAQVAAGDVVTATHVTAAIEATSSRSRNAFEWIWKGLPPAARAVAAALAPAGPDGLSEAAIHGELRESGAIALLPALRDAPTKLVASDLVESPSPGKYRFRVELLRRLVARYKPPSYIQQDLDLIDPAAEDLCRAGESAQRSGDLAAAKARYVEALDKNPNHGRASEQLADVLIARKEWDAARALLERIHEVRPASARARRQKLARAEAEDARAQPSRPPAPRPSAAPAASARAASTRAASTPDTSALTRALEAEKQARAAAEARATDLAKERDRLLVRLRAEAQPSIAVGPDPAALTKALDTEKQARTRAEVRASVLISERDRLRATTDALEAERGRLQSALELIALERDQLAADLDARDRPSQLGQPSSSARAAAPPPPATPPEPVAASLLAAPPPIAAPLPPPPPEPVAIAPQPLPSTPPAAPTAPPSAAPQPTDPAVVLSKPRPAARPRSPWSRHAAPAFAITGALAIAAAAALQTTRIEPSETAITLVGPSATRRVTIDKVLRIGKRRPASNVTWSSADPRVATVDEQGVVTPVGSGKTQIEARVGGHTSTVQVTVRLSRRAKAPPAKPAEPVATAAATAAPTAAPATGCEGGNADACVELGRAAEKDAKNAKDRAAALAYHEKGCDGGALKGCVEAGGFYEDGKVGKPDSKKAMALYTKACDAKEPSGCSRLGAVYELGIGVVPNIAKARELHGAACDAGDAYGCWHLGAIYELGNGVARDTPTAGGYYQKACDGGQYAACASLANMYWNGSGKVAKDVQKGLALYEKACDAKHEPSCTVLALNYKAGEGVPLDRKKSYAFFWKACQAGSKSACRIAPRAPEP